MRQTGHPSCERWGAYPPFTNCDPFHEYLTLAMPLPTARISGFDGAAPRRFLRPRITLLAPSRGARPGAGQNVERLSPRRGNELHHPLHAVAVLLAAAFDAEDPCDRVAVHLVNEHHVDVDGHASQPRDGLGEVHVPHPTNDEVRPPSPVRSRASDRSLMSSASSGVLQGHERVAGASFESGAGKTTTSRPRGETTRSGRRISRDVHP